MKLSSIYVIRPKYDQFSFLTGVSEIFRSFVCTYNNKLIINFITNISVIITYVSALLPMCTQRGVLEHHLTCVFSRRSEMNMGVDQTGFTLVKFCKPVEAGGTFVRVRL